MFFYAFIQVFAIDGGKNGGKKLFLVEYSKIFTCIKNYQLMCYS